MSGPDEPGGAPPNFFTAPIDERGYVDMRATPTGEQAGILSRAAKAIIDRVPYGYGMTYSEARLYAGAVMAICAEVANAVADEQDVLAIGADESNFAGYRQGERVAKQIAEMIGKPAA